MSTMELPKSTTKWELITPELAKEYLILNKNMRPLNRAAVAQYKAEILSGNYRQNGEVIVFDSDGYLRDGQHRLTAIVESGVAVWINVVRGVDPDQCDVFDVGGKRTVKQIIGGTSTTMGAAVAGRIASGITTSKIIPAKSVKYYLEHQDDCEWAASITCVGGSHPVGKKLGCQVAAYLAYRNGVSKYEIANFFRIANSNEPTFDRECGAALKLFKMLTNEYKGKVGGSTIGIVCSVTLQTIMDFANGKKKKWYKPNDDWKNFYDFVKIQDGIKLSE